MKPFKKEQVNQKLKPLGWEIPEGIKYKGMLGNHAVKCIKCGYIQEKRLDNLIYRQEQCPMCGDGIFEETLQGHLIELKEAINELKMELLNSLVKSNKDETNTNDLKALFRRYIAKKGFKMQGRKLMSDEWHKLSHQLAEQLMLEVSTSAKEFEKWEEQYTSILSEKVTQQGQDVLLSVIPDSKHGQLRDALAKRMVKL